MYFLLFISVIVSSSLYATTTEIKCFPEIDKFPLNIEQFTHQPTESGGTNSTFLLKDQGQTKFVIKHAKNIDQFKEEVLADGIYQTISIAEPSFGINTPQFQIRNNNGQLSRISEFLPGNALGFRQIEDVAKGFIVDVFMANWDITVSGKNLWLSEGIIHRIDNGGALGETKASIGYDFSQAVSDLYTLRGLTYPLNPLLTTNQDGARFYAHLTQAEILEQITKLVILQEQILKTADLYHSWLNIKDYSTFRSNLITRLDSLKSYYYDQVQPIPNYKQAHPFSVAIPEKSSASVLIVADHMGHKQILYHLF